MFQAPAPVCLAGIWSESPWLNRGKVSWGKLKSCCLSEQVKTSNVSGSCVCKRCEVGERSISVFAKRMESEKWKRRENPEKEAVKSILCEL